MQHFDQLEDRALALGHAHTLYKRSKQPPPELLDLAEEDKALHAIDALVVALAEPGGTVLTSELKGLLVLAEFAQRVKIEHI